MSRGLCPLAGFQATIIGGLYVTAQDSLAGTLLICLRRSREICGEERKKKVRYISRRDYYIEWTCRYKGPALHGRCAKRASDSLRFAPSILRWASVREISLTRRTLT
jgi:hypothetical protein